MQGASGAWGLNFAALVVAQVLNIRSSIKVAEDFVSPEHIERCLTLTEHFRALPPSHRRTQDTLGVKDIMLHAVSHAVSLCEAA